MATYFGSALTGLNATTATNINGTSTANNLKSSTHNTHARTRTSISRIRFDNTVANFTTADVVHAMILKPNDRLLKLELASDDTGTSGSIDVGLYYVTQRDGALVFTVSDADLFATAVVLNTSATAWTNILHESGQVLIEYTGRPLYEIAGLNSTVTYTSTTDKLFSISVTPSANTTGNFSTVLMATYIAGD